MPEDRSDNPDVPAVPAEHLAEIDSTNLEARRRIRAGAARPFALVAARQTGGLGRLGRAWASPPGGLWLTLAAPVAGLDPRLGLRAGLGVLRAIDAACAGPAGLRLKWPNDVMAGDRKVAGVLVEVVAHDRRSWALVGVGVNADLRLSDLPPDLRATAATLRDVLGGPVDLDRLESEVLAAVGAVLTSEAGAADDLRDVGRLLWGVGRPAVINLADTTSRRGVIRGLDGDGALLVDTPEGPWRVGAGEEIALPLDQPGSSGSSGAPGSS